MDPLWTPPAGRQQRSRVKQWIDALIAAGALTPGAGYDEAWAWSVSNLGPFWESVAATFGVQWDQPPTEAFRSGPGGSVEGAHWFAGARVNYARHALQPVGVGPDDAVIIARSETRPPVDLTLADLRALVGRVRVGLLTAGVGPGDRVAGYLPNVPEALAAYLATASLGAIWTCCASEMGPQGALDRLAQVRPRVLIAADGYRFGDRVISRREQAEAIDAGLPSPHAAIWLPYLDPDGDPPAGWMTWADFTAGPAQLSFADVPFEHPMVVLYSSGTTGKPKAIVHGHGGLLLEHLKALGWHFDLGPSDRFFWFTTTGWMMWNFLVSGLLVGSPIVLFDGNPTWPAPDALWKLIADEQVTCAGMGAASLVAGHKTGLRPGSNQDLSRLRTLGSTGSPLPAAAAAWVYDAVSPDIMLASYSGGTDVCTGLVGTTPLHPVWAGEISARCLGTKAEVYDDRGRPVIGEEGELVLTEPLPSMPVSFWGDDDGRRYHEAYFDRFQGVWAHGDRMTLTDRGTCVITGRSDGTLNRGGVRLGTGEFYEVVESFNEVADSLVVHVEDPSGGPGTLWLFVVPAGAAPEVPSGLVDRITRALREQLSPRHVPDRIVAVPDIPRTLTGKKLEVPVKRLLSGVPIDRALTLASVANPDAIDALLQAAGAAT